MDFKYSRHDLTVNEQRAQRFFEMLPGLICWFIIIGIVVFSVLQPLMSAVFMVAFLLYWFLRLVYMNIFLVVSYWRLTIEKNIAWLDRLKALDDGTLTKEAIARFKKGKGFGRGIAARLHARQIKDLQAQDLLPLCSEDIYHLVIIPVLKEPREIVEPGLMAMKDGNYPGDRIIILIALEERAADDIRRDMTALQHAYKKDFMDFIITLHPADLPNEARVKGANVSYAAKEAARYFERKKIPFDNVVISCFDADTVPNPGYFGCLTYYYMITPERTRASFQPIPVYHNNIWDAPGFARIIDIGTSYFQLIEATNPWRLVTFSSHSMSFKALVEIGYWPVDMISDDSAIFWKALIHYDGDYRVVPLYTTVSMDIATGSNTGKTLLNIYKQKRRWAWGVENFPIIMRAFIKMKTIAFYDKIAYAFKMLDSFVSWATWSFLLMFGSWLPVLFASRDFATSTVYYTAPRIRGVIYSLASMGLVVCMIISLLLLPRPRSKYGFFAVVWHIFEWLSIPIIILFLSALPALDAQTRLMLADRLEFSATEKYRRKQGEA
jgi:hypothetical protein